MKKIKYLVFAIIFTMILSVPIVSVFAAQPNNLSDYAVIRINYNDKLQNVPNFDNANEIVLTYRQGSEDFGTLTITGSGLYTDNNNNVYAPLNSNVTINGAGHHPGRGGTGPGHLLHCPSRAAGA